MESRVSENLFSPTLVRTYITVRYMIMISFSSPPPSLLYVQGLQPGLGNAADWRTKAAAVRILRASALVTKWPAYCTLVKKQISYRYDMKWFLTCLLLEKVVSGKTKESNHSVVGRWTQQIEGEWEMITLVFSPRPMVCSSLDFHSNLIYERMDRTGPGRSARSLSNGNERF